jgi:hypothetical protein
MRKLRPKKFGAHDQTEFMNRLIQPIMATKRAQPPQDCLGIGFPALIETATRFCRTPGDRLPGTFS